MKLSSLFSFFALAAGVWGQEGFDDPHRMAEAPVWELRRSALHEVLARYKLSDPALQAGIVRLTERESNDPRWEEIEEELAYESYYAEIVELCQKVATTYRNAAAWHAVLYSNYNEDSPWAKNWLVAQPELLSSFWGMAHSSTPFYAARGTMLLAEAVARCSQPHTKNCSGPISRRADILHLVRDRVRAKDEVISSGAVVALGVAGSATDVPFLKERIREVERVRVSSSIEEQSKASTVGLLKLSMSKIAEREAKSRQSG